MAVGLWLLIGCIIRGGTLHEDVVGLMWHGRETSGGIFCEIPGVHKRQGNFPLPIFVFSRVALCV